MLAIHCKNFSSGTLWSGISIFDILKREKPDYFAVAFDKGGSVDRNEIFEDYKANRDSTPEPIIDSVPIIHEILDALGIKTLELSGYEADDIIGTVAKQAEKEGLISYMVTPDKILLSWYQKIFFYISQLDLAMELKYWELRKLKINLR